MVDKIKYYLGQVKGKPGTNIYDLLELADKHDDFDEEDIARRNEKIIEEFMNFIQANHLA